MFKKLKRGGKKSGDVIVDGIDKVVISKVDKNKVIKDACRTGNILQFVSRVTGFTLRWMATKETLDGLGSFESDAKSTLWTVNLVSESIKDGTIIQLHNEGYFLSIVDGETKLTEHEDPSTAGEETLLKLSIVEQFVQLEAADGCGHHIGVLNNGDLKAAIATGTEMESHFAPRVIHSAPMENGDHTKSSTEVVNGGAIELEPVENEQEPKEEIKEDGEEKPEKKKSKLVKLKESFRGRRSKSRELLTPKKEATESKGSTDDIAAAETKEGEEVTKTEESTEEKSTEITEKSTEITEKSSEIVESTDTPNVDKIETVEPTNSPEAVTITS